MKYGAEMGLFRKSSDTQSVTALVTAAGAPPQNLMARSYGDWVFVVADLGSGPTLIRSVVHLDRDRWLVPGMHVPIEINPDKTEKVHAFSVDWDGVPTIAERVASNDPTLADPRTARQTARQARAGATDRAHAPTSLLNRFEQPLFGVGENTIAPSSGFSTDTSSWTAACDAAIAAAATQPAPTGKQRAVVILTAMRMVFRNIGHHLDGTPDLLGDNTQSSFEAALTGNETVLSVNVPGRAPYAVFEKSFKAPHGKPVTQTPNLYPWLPALVSVSDPTAVEILWDEVADEMGQVSDKIGQAYEDAAARQQTVLDAFQQGRANAGGAPQSRPELAASLAAITDPMQRALAVAAAAGAAQASQQTVPTDPDAALRKDVQFKAGLYRAADPKKQQKLLANFRMQLSMMDPDLSAKTAALMRAEGLDV